MKIFRPNFKNIQENIHGFSKIQRNVIPVNSEQKATINRIKTEYSGFSGTPDQTLTGGLPLRRRSLYTTELQGHMQKYSIVQLRWTRDRQMLGGDRSIQLSYQGVWREFLLWPMDGAEDRKNKDFPALPGRILRKCPKHARIPKVF